MHGKQAARMDVEHLRETFVLPALLLRDRNHSAASCLKMPVAVNSSIGLIGAVMSNE